MKQKAGVNRRQFLTSSSAAAMGIAAVSGTPLSAEDAGTAKAAISKPREAPKTGNPLRTYAGAAAGEVAFPLGGIGTGTVSLGGRGELRDWEIFNRPAKRRILPFSFVALWAKPEGERPLSASHSKRGNIQLRRSILKTAHFQ